VCGLVERLRVLPVLPVNTLLKLRTRPSFVIVVFFVRWLMRAKMITRLAILVVRAFILIIVIVSTVLMRARIVAPIGVITAVAGGTVIRIVA